MLVLRGPGGLVTNPWRRAGDATAIFCDSYCTIGPSLSFGWGKTWGRVSKYAPITLEGLSFSQKSKNATPITLWNPPITLQGLPFQKFCAGQLKEAVAALSPEVQLLALCGHNKLSHPQLTKRDMYDNWTSVYPTEFDRFIRAWAR